MMRSRLQVALGAALLLLLSPPRAEGGQPTSAEGGQPASAAKPPAGTQIATFAGGCFWCMQPPFDALPGVVSTTVGYTGGHTKDPSYEQVESGTTGHAEAIQVVFDPARVSYARLLDVFWHNIDPTTADREFCDVGSQYRTAIFVHDDTQRRLAEASKASLEKSGRFGAPIATEIVAAGTFYPAEEYHQKYYVKHSLRYHFYRAQCGRDAYLEKIWGPAASPH